jgi:hypothetical protein
MLDFLKENIFALSTTHNHQIIPSKKKKNHQIIKNI